MIDTAVGHDILQVTRTRAQGGKRNVLHVFNLSVLRLGALKRCERTNCNSTLNSEGKINKSEVLSNVKASCTLPLYFINFLIYASFTGILSTYR